MRISFPKYQGQSGVTPNLNRNVNNVVAGALCVCGAQKKAHGTGTASKSAEVAKKDVVVSVAPAARLEPSGGT